MAIFARKSPQALFWDRLTGPNTDFRVDSHLLKQTDLRHHAVGHQEQAL